MRLKSLEIKGFKSFGDKVTINFDEGVTAIVGPNGSGKSNVVDAMRWVLGEQKTRLLRSEKMENIIFNGTRTRKPANLAEVALTFENTRNILPTEFSTITITRRYYRSGESEYLLNGVTCRLKDITDLFLDTGIGPDSYSIIELKMIDDLINDRNNTLKSLLEEAAGISKYKVRKKQTYSKLEETETDLSRVNDLLFEIEKNLKSLESQAKKAERYYKLKDEYKELSQIVAIFSIQEFKASYERLEEQETQINDASLALDAQLDTIEAALQAVKLENVDHEKHLQASQKALNEKINTIRQVENDKKLKNERLSFLSEKEQTLTLTLQRDKQNQSELQDQVGQLEESREIDSDQLADLEDKLNEVKVIVEELRMQQSSVQEEAGKFSKEIQLVQEEVFKQEKLIAIQQTQHEALSKEVTRLETEVEQRQNELTQAEEQLEPVSIQKEHIDSQLEELQGQDSSIIEKIQTAELTVQQKNNEFQDLNRRLDSKQNEYNLTKSLVENLEGFPESIKYLKKKSGVLAHAPLLSDVVAVDQDYKAAIENYLDPYMNFFVLKEVSEAAVAIEKLKESKNGRSHFFLTDGLKKTTVNKEIPTGSISALDVVKVDKEYQDLINHLLHDVVLVEGKEWLSKDTGEWVVLNKQGEFYKSQIKASGGSIGLFDGKRIGRAKNLEILQEDIAQIEKSRQLVKVDLENWEKELQKLKQELQGLQQRKNQFQNESNRISSQHSSLKARFDQLKNLVEGYVKRKNELAAQLEVLNAQMEQQTEGSAEGITDLRLRKEEIQSELIKRQDRLNALSNELNQSSQSLNHQNIAFVQQQNKVNTIQRELVYKKNQIDSLARTISQNSDELDKIKEQTKALLAMVDSDNEMKEMYEEKESLEQAVTELERVYYGGKAQIDEQEQQVRDLRKRKDGNLQIQQQLKDKISDLKIQLNSLKERLMVEFELAIETIMDQEPSEEWNEAESRNKLEKTRQSVQSYGPINPMAVEAYNEIKERYDFINVQKKDLEDAKHSLLATIAEIDTTAKDMYLTAYHQIRNNFVTVFRSLFTDDDTCDLVLSDMENPLEAEVNIFAQPKGKRPQSLSQLSSGEKTLTATALLFGVYLLKPAPFCIFDEVDAPLDDANVDKFNKIIKRFSEETQFIVITHNKRTMSHTELIYGITMVEQGVTQAVPVDMREVA